jgi:hydroxymethylpyrimidine pyrophosphatase-like HAD family hydrolase
MGKPYAKDIAAFPSTLKWAEETNIGTLISAVAAMGSFPLYAVGSGGAFSTSVQSAQLHQLHCGQMARPLTPLAATQAPVRKASVLLLSASGRNPDIIGCFRRLLDLEPEVMTVLCLRRDSPLARLARKHPQVYLIEENLPSGKDGFVATNSVLAFSALLWRAYSLAFTGQWPGPGALTDLLGTEQSCNSWMRNISSIFQPLAGRQNFIVLYGPSLEAAASDLESKFSEAALGSLQMSDYRNFAHGRHHWIAKRGASTGVIALIAKEDSHLATRTLELLPKTIPVAKINVPGAGIEAGACALAIAQFIASAAGKAVGIDPGRPGVPEFGRKLYNLKTWRYEPPKRETVAIDRKRAAAPVSSAHDVTSWPAELRRVLARIGAARFKGIVFDYDGTLCDEPHRFKAMPKEVAPFLSRLLERNVRVAIATGRGSSVKQAIRQTIQSKLWAKVTVGYYNCSQIGTLDDDFTPTRNDTPAEPLRHAATILGNSEQLNACAQIEIRGPQIVISPKFTGYAHSVREWVAQLIASEFQKGVICVHSTHSVDVIVSTVNKLNILSHLRDQGIGGSDILCIGDLGRWPGNDFALLDNEFGLSTNQVSARPGSCWNLAPPGVLNLRATLHYLERLEIRQGYFKVNTSRLMGS